MTSSSPPQPPDAAEPVPAATPGPSATLRAALGLLAAVALLLGAFAAGSTFGPQMPASAIPGPIDVGFTQDMSVHHAQAVEMAGIELAGGAEPAVKTLAYDILTAQQNHLGKMEGWLIAWNRPLLPSGGYRGWMRAPPSDDSMPGMARPMQHGPVKAMPGMASPAELAQLRSAPGVERDVLFLQLMLRHHLGGEEMLQVAAESAETGYVRDLAAQMLRTQNADIQLIKQLLAQRNATALPLK